MPTLLHAACGPATMKDLAFLRVPTTDEHGPITVPMFDGARGWKEVRLDIDDQYGADIVGDIRYPNTWRSSAVDVPYQNFDAVFCSHALEHLHLYDAPLALKTFASVLNPDGTVTLIVPNFEAACRHVVNGHGAKLYDAPAGPIFAHEVVYGKENWTADNVYQRHLTGYTPDLLRGLVVGAGFQIEGFWVDDLNIMIAARGRQRKGEPK